VQAVEGEVVGEESADTEASTKPLNTNSNKGKHGSKKRLSQSEVGSSSQKKLKSDKMSIPPKQAKTNQGKNSKKTQSAKMTKPRRRNPETTM